MTTLTAETLAIEAIAQLLFTTHRNSHKLFSPAKMADQSLAEQSRYRGIARIAVALLDEGQCEEAEFDVAEFLHWEFTDRGFGNFDDVDDRAVWKFFAIAKAATKHFCQTLQGVGLSGGERQRARMKIARIKALVDGEVRRCTVEAVDPPAPSIAEDSNAE